MKIWIFNHYAKTPNYAGGSRHFDLAKELIKKGHEVTIFASSFNHLLKKETIEYERNNYYKEEIIENVRFVWLKTIQYNNSFKRILNMISYSIKSYRIAKKMARLSKPDIIIGSSVHPLAAIVGYRVSNITGSLFYFEERDLWPQTFIDFGKISSINPLAIILYKIEKYLYNRSHRIIVLFEKAVNYVESRGVDNNKVIYIPNGVDIKRYQNIEKDNEIYKIFPPKNQIVIYIGSHGIANHLSPLLDVAYYLQYVEKNNSVHFVFVGNGPLKSSLIEDVRKKNLENITFMDPIPKSKIPYLLSLADLSMISIKKSPLYKWGFSMNKLYDYMAAGLPIMIYSNGQVVGDLANVHGINYAESSSEFAKQVIKRINDEKYRETASENLQKYVKDNYSWSKLATKLEYYMLMDKKK